MTGVRRFLNPFGIFLIMMSYPLLSMIWRHQYPLLSAEVLLFFTSIMLVALLLTVLTAACRPLLANTILAVGITLIFILQFNLLLEGSVILLAVTVLLGLTLGEKFQQLALVIFVAVIIGAYIDTRLDRKRDYNQLAESGQQASLPPVVHIMLDGFIGPMAFLPRACHRRFALKSWRISGKMILRFIARLIAIINPRWILSLTHSISQMVPRICTENP